MSHISRPQTSKFEAHFGLQCRGSTSSTGVGLQVSCSAAGVSWAVSWVLPLVAILPPAAPLTSASLTIDPVACSTGRPRLRSVTKAGTLPKCSKPLAPAKKRAVKPLSGTGKATVKRACSAFFGKRCELRGICTCADRVFAALSKFCLDF